MIEATVAALLGIIVSVVSYLFSKQKRRKRKGNSVNLGEMSVDFGPIKITKLYGGGEPEPIITSGLVKRMEEQVLARVQSSGVSRQEVQKEVKAQVAEIQDRIAKIENRFPDEAKMDKVASINDALLSERIDQLSKQVENLENKMLSHWDVAVVVGGIITGIIAIVGATYGVLKATGVIP